MTTTRITVELIDPCGLLVTKNGDHTEHWFTVADVQALQLAVRRCQHTQMRFEEERQRLTVQALTNPQLGTVLADLANTTPEDAPRILATLNEIAAAPNPASDDAVYTLAETAADEITNIAATYWATLLGVNASEIPGNLGYESLTQLETHVTASPFHSLTTSEQVT